MTDLVLTTFDWVPEMPRGYVRDLRVRWALEEAGLPYRVQSVPFGARGAEHEEVVALAVLPGVPVAEHELVVDAAGARDRGQFCVPRHGLLGRQPRVDLEGQQEAAELMKVSRRAVQHAAKVRDEGAPPN